jgi:hypothetical protein
LVQLGKLPVVEFFVHWGHAGHIIAQGYIINEHPCPEREEVWVVGDGKETTPLGVRLVVEGPLAIRDGVVAVQRVEAAVQAGRKG